MLEVLGLRHCLQTVRAARVERCVRSQHRLAVEDGEDKAPDVMAKAIELLAPAFLEAVEGAGKFRLDVEDLVADRDRRLAAIFFERDGGQHLEPRHALFVLEYRTERRGAPAS